MRKKPHICDNLQMEYKVRKYPCHHQIPLLADDREESKCNLRLYQSRAGGLYAGDQKAVYLHGCRYWTGFAKHV